VQESIIRKCVYITGKHEGQFVEEVIENCRRATYEVPGGEAQAFPSGLSPDVEDSEEVDDGEDVPCRFCVLEWSHSASRGD